MAAVRVNETQNGSGKTVRERDILTEKKTQLLNCLRTLKEYDGCFFSCSIKSPQCNDKQKIYSMAIFLPCVLMNQNVKFHFRWGTKPRDQKLETENDCDVISGLQASRKTDFYDIFLFS